MPPAWDRVLVLATARLRTIRTRERKPIPPHVVVFTLEPWSWRLTYLDGAEPFQALVEAGLHGDHAILVLESDGPPPLLLLLGYCAFPYRVDTIALPIESDGTAGEPVLVDSDGADDLFLWEHRIEA